MSETRTPAPEAGQKRITELRVSGHLMTLDTGTFCVFRAPGSAIGNNKDLGLPGVRISLPPGPAHNPDEVAISTFRQDGWLGGSDAAALIRILSGPAQVLVTIYQAPGEPAETAPRLQVLRLAGDMPAPSAPQPDNRADLSKAEVVAHIQVAGDVGGKLGEWMGIRGSKNWIEGFSILPPAPLKAEDIEYQAVLGRGWLSPWVDGGQFCGSRGMALPLLGLRIRLKGDAAGQYDCVCQASFVDGAEIGPLPDGAACQTETLAPLEAFQINLTRNKATAAEPAKRPASKFSAQKPVAIKTTPTKAVAASAKPAAKPRPMQRSPGRPAR